jgi:hypothetical protein
MSHPSQTEADNLAIADLTALSQDTPVTTPPAVEAEVKPEPTETAVEATASDTPKEPEIAVDTYEKRYKDLQSTFTKKTQKLSELETEVGQYRNWYSQYQAWLAQQQQPQQPTEDPDAFPTVQKVQDIIRDTVAKERAVILTEAQKQIAAAKVEDYKYQYAQEIGKYAQSIIDSEPLLKAQLEDAEDTSLYENMVKHAQNKLFGPKADEDTPRDIDTFKAEMKAFATRKVATLKKLITNHEQAAAAGALKATKPSMTAPGGKIPAAQAPAKVPKMGTQAFRDYLTEGLIEEQRALDARK